MYNDFDEVFDKRNEMVKTFQLIDDIYLLDCVCCDFVCESREEYYKICKMVGDVWQHDNIGLSYSKISAMLYDFMKENNLTVDEAYEMYKDDFSKFGSYIITQYLCEAAKRESTKTYLDVLRGLMKEKNKKFKLF